MPDPGFYKHGGDNKAVAFNEKMRKWLEDADAMMDSRQRIMRAQDEKIRQLRKRLTALCHSHEDIAARVSVEANSDDDVNTAGDTTTSTRGSSRRSGTVHC